MPGRPVRTLLLAIALLSRAGLASAGDQAQAIESLLTGYRDVGVFNGAALVSENGRVIFKKGFGLADFEWGIPNTPDTRFRVGSITKQFTATLVMQLVEEGKLSLDTTLATALPYYRKDTAAKITVHHLLNHTSGIPSYTGQPNFMKEVSRDPYGVRDFVLKFCSSDLEFEPGGKFRYNNSGYFILGAIIEHVLGKTYDRAVRERIFEPLGMNGSGYDAGRPVLERRARAYERGPAGLTNADYLDMSLPFAAGALYSTVEDLYLWDQALYGERVLSAASKQRMFAPGLEQYGYGWNIRKEPIGPGKAERTTIGHGGGINGFSTLITRVPEDRHLVVLFNNTGGTNLRAIFEGIADVLYERKPAPPKKAIAAALYQTIAKSGVAAAVAEYRQIKKSRAAEFEMGEGQLARLGDELLREKRAAEAVEILKLNVELFPLSGNVHGRLAEAHVAAGDKELAIKSYARALELNPGNRNALDKLNELVKQ